MKGDFLVVRLGTPWLCVSSWYEVLLAGTDPRIVRFFWTSGATGSLYDADFTHDAFVCTVEDSAKYQCNGTDDRVCCCSEINLVVSTRNLIVREDMMFLDV